MNSFHLLLVIVGLTLIFEFSNGWHDAANSIATVVSTRVLTPLRAVVWASFWNIFFPAKMRRTGSSMTTFTMDFYVIYEIRHIFLIVS